MQGRKIQINRAWKDLIKFLYPGYEVREVSEEFQDFTIFYHVQKPPQDAVKFLKRVGDLKKSILVTDSPYISTDIDLSTREEVLKLVSERIGKKIPVTLEKRTEKMPEDLFFSFIKSSLLWKEWDKSYFTAQEKAVYRIFDPLMESSTVFAGEYFKLLEEWNPEQLFSSVLGLLEKIETFEDRDDLSDFYKVLVKRGQNQDFKFLKAVLKLAELPGWLRDDLKYLWFFVNLK